MRRIALTATLPLALFAATAPFPTEARDWRMLEDESRIGFTFRQMGSAVRGSFDEFSTEINFDPNALESASVRTEIAIASVNTGNSERDAGIVGADWFDTANHPTASFVSTGFTHQDGDAYLVTGDLTVRGITEPVELLMTISINGSTATATGAIDLDRRTFEVGRGDWASDAAVGHGVILEIEVQAEAAD